VCVFVYMYVYIYIYIYILLNKVIYFGSFFVLQSLVNFGKPASIIHILKKKNHLPN